MFRRLADNGVKRFYLDYIQLVTAPHLPKANKLERLEHVSESLQALCQQLDISIVAMAQLNRESEKRGDRRPELIDLSGADKIAQDAGMVVFLHRPRVDDPFSDSPPAVTKAEMIVGKNRFGQSDIIKQFGWYGERGRFVSTGK
jgi:replicative DNA helicase